jgi:hypothetical protein
MTSVRLRIDHVALELTAEQRAADAEDTLRTALALLASRLAGAPLGGGRDAPLRALELLELEPLSPEWIAGPGAAARLADELYRRIVGAVA